MYIHNKGFNNNKDSELPDFFGTTYQNGKNIYQMTKNTPTGDEIKKNGRKIFQLAIEYLYQHFPF
jgi:hypothetical protein